MDEAEKVYKFFRESRSYLLPWEDLTKIEQKEFCSLVERTERFLGFILIERRYRQKMRLK